MVLIFYENDQSTLFGPEKCHLSGSSKTDGDVNCPRPSNALRIPWTPVLHIYNLPKRNGFVFEQQMLSNALIKNSNGVRNQWRLSLEKTPADSEEIG